MKITQLTLLACVLLPEVLSQGNVSRVEPIVLIHGGAGDMPNTFITGKIKAVKLAARIGYKVLQETGSVLDAVQEAVRSMELDENLNAGYGSVLTWDAEVEMDAAIMHGSDLNAGCVSILKDVLHPIEVARRVMERTPHNYLAGEGAMRFVADEGIEILPMGSLVTERSLKALKDYKNSLNISNSNAREFGEPGTVGAVAIDAEGNIAVATSTGGITGKLPGRIGDSPILGSGTYADNRFGGVSATGHGEFIMRYNVAQKILSLIEFKGLGAQAATEEVLKGMTAKLNGTAGAITIGANGDVGIYFTTSRMVWAYQKAAKIHFGLQPGEDHVEDIN